MLRIFELAINIIMPFYRFILVTLIGTFLFFGALAQPKTGDIAPEVELPNPDGQSVSLHSLKGKVVLIDFWASWCGPCRFSNKRLAPVYEKYKTTGFEIFAISIDENKNAWKKAIAADNIKWIQVNEAGGWQAPIARKWGIDQIPTSFLLDKDGSVVAIDPSEEKLISLLKKLLK